MNNSYEEQTNVNTVPNNDSPEEKEKSYGLTSMVLGILSVVTSGLIIGLPCGIAAIILAIKDKAYRGVLKSFAIPGLITGIAGTVVGAAMTLYLCFVLLIMVIMIIFYIIFIFGMFFFG